MIAYSDRAILALCLLFTLFRLCESSRKYNPYFSISLSSGRFHVCHFRNEGGGPTTCRDRALPSGDVYGLDFVPGRQYVEKIRNSLNKNQ